MTKLGVPQKSIPQELLLNKNGEIVTQVVQIPTIQMDFVEAKIFSMTMEGVFKDTKWNPNYKSKLSGMCTLLLFFTTEKQMQVFLYT